MKKTGKVKLEIIRKEIHLPKESAKDLKIAAAYADKSSKRYMEDLIIAKVEEDLRRIKMKGIKNHGDFNEPKSHFLKNPGNQLIKKAFRFRV